MRKWAFIYVAAAVAVIGCGGTGGGTPSAGNAVTTPVVNGIGVKLTNGTSIPPGAIEVAYLTGQGRAAGDLTAVVTRVDFNDTFGTVNNPLAPQTDCPLVGFQDNIVHLDVPFTNSAALAPSRQFTSFKLDFNGFIVQNSAGASVQETEAQSGVALPKSYPAQFRVFPGRTTSLPIYVDDSMFVVSNPDSAPFSVSYVESQFQLSNGATAANPIKGFISDFVSFNLNSSLLDASANKIAADAGLAGRASRVFFSGDVYAITDGATNGSHIAALTLNPSQTIIGNLGSAGNINGPTGTLPHAGTYSLLAPNPTDITQVTKIVASQGIWREHTSVLTGLSATGLNVVTFPSSNDDNVQEMVAFTQDALGNVTSIYFGFVDLDAGTFNLYPITDIVSASTAGVMAGTITNLLQKDGKTKTASPDLVRSGTFNFAAGTGITVPGTAKTVNTGKFFVFRV